MTVVTVQDREKCLALYQWLRDVNPWLPEADRIPVDRELTVTVVADGFASLTLTVCVDLPTPGAVEAGATS